MVAGRATQHPVMYLKDTQVLEGGAKTSGWRNTKQDALDPLEAVESRLQRWVPARASGMGRAAAPSQNHHRKQDAELFHHYRDLPHATPL